MTIELIQKADYFGGWDWSQISPFIPIHIARKIATIKPSSASLGSDVPGWRWESNRTFSTSSAYEWLVHSHSPPPSFNWHMLWQLKVPPRVKVFLWVTVHDWLLTNSERVHRHFVVSDRCSICNDCCESADHVFRHCRMATALWVVVIKPVRLHQFLSLPFGCNLIFRGLVLSLLIWSVLGSNLWFTYGCCGKIDLIEFSITHLFCSLTLAKFVEPYF
ncbi:hypothetical protein V6N12_042731 [Hibiscus sabdariffa]|uniref:Reverse transcriptase zinc-binding domain-containing protein n=1 Tax=Hibiscus sabdariffa TaxID=183260 RepID=A0ABR2B0L9_9ROSI